jgi:hypothetical protein
MEAVAADAPLTMFDEVAVRARGPLSHLRFYPYSWKAEALGITVDFTPKFHAEIAGEGVEYSWGHSKAEEVKGFVP